jgi:hypothetical protein
LQHILSKTVPCSFWISKKKLRFPPINHTYSNIKCYRQYIHFTSNGPGVNPTSQERGKCKTSWKTMKITPLNHIPGTFFLFFIPLRKSVAYWFAAVCLSVGQYVGWPDDVRSISWEPFVRLLLLRTLSSKPEIFYEQPAQVKKDNL